MNTTESNFSPPTLKRNEYGLFDHVKYEYNKEGFVNWRAMVNPEHLFVNKGWYEARNNPAPTSIEGLEDQQLLIKLSGIKELARLRGLASVKYEVVKCEPQYVAVKCGVEWIENYEYPFRVYYEDIANATVDNTSNFGVKFLETIAANRAFVRAVRNFLNIHIVGSDEIDSSGKKGAAPAQHSAEVSLPSAQEMLESAAASCGYGSFIKFQDFVSNAVRMKLYENAESDSWQSFDDVPVKEARVLIGMLKDSYGKK